MLPAVLELEPRYLKAVMRRAQASEALEKYEDALEGNEAHNHSLIPSPYSKLSVKK